MKVNLNTCTGHSQGLVVARQDVACWPTTAGGIFVDGGAAIRFEDLDISPYEGVAGTLTNYKIKLYDNDLYACEGYLAEADGALAFGADVVVNGTFDVDDNWVKETGWTIADGVANCDGNQEEATDLRTIIAPLTEDKLFRLTYDLTRTSGTICAALGSTNRLTTQNSNGTYTEYGIVSGNTHIYFFANADFVGTIDNLVAQEVTALGADGCHVVSAKNGNTQNWKSKHASFDYNDPDGYKAEILIAK